MKKIILLILVFGVLGLIFGYLFFGKIGGEYLDLKFLFKTPDNPLENFGRKVAGIREIKQNILISGGVGAVVGIILYYIRRK
ncbi:MAG: hypothetical protein V2I54_08540 [Bacteroidales bacterium]|jgi:hypothetical protein|nr:hypothetical protein [Bacteroidales bacterium]